MKRFLARVATVLSVIGGIVVLPSATAPALADAPVTPVTGLQLSSTAATVTAQDCQADGSGTTTLTSSGQVEDSSTGLPTGQSWSQDVTVTFGPQGLNGAPVTNIVGNVSVTTSGSPIVLALSFSPSFPVEGPNLGICGFGATLQRVRAVVSSDGVVLDQGFVTWSPTSVVIWLHPSFMLNSSVRFDEGVADSYPVAAPDLARLTPGVWAQTQAIRVETPTVVHVRTTGGGHGHRRRGLPSPGHRSDRPRR